MGARIPKNSPLWKTYEAQIANLVASLDATAEVVHNKRVDAKLSKVKRQVDVWVRGTIIGQELTIAIECKRHTRPLEIGIIDEFVGKLLDLGVDRGIIYSASGMTPSAVDRATFAINPSVIPVSLQPAPGIRGVPGLPAGYEDSDYAEWLDSATYRRLLVSKQWSPYYIRSEVEEKDQRWQGLKVFEEDYWVDR